MMMLMVSNLEALVNSHSVCKHLKSVHHFVKSFVDILFLSSPPPYSPSLPFSLSHFFIASSLMDTDFFILGII